MAKSDTSADTTHFGYKTVPVDDKANLVKGVFDSVASNYDIMNDLMSGGLHRLWKRRTIEQAADELAELVPEARIGVGHGQMPKRQLEGVMNDFYHRQLNLLVCTTII